MRTKICMLALAGVCAFSVWSITRPREVPFQKVLIDSGASETAAFADINGDGKLDLVVIAGRANQLVWYENRTPPAKNCRVGRALRAPP